MEDGQVQVVGGNRPTDQLRPHCTQVRVQPVQGTSQPVVVHLCAIAVRTA